MYKVELRYEYLGIGPFQRSPERTDQANGFKPKTVKTCAGEVTFAVPQVRSCRFRLMPPNHDYQLIGG